MFTLGCFALLVTSQSATGLIKKMERKMCLSVPGKIISIAGDDPLTRSAKVSFGGTIKDVNLAYVPDAEIGDYVIVHVGFALNTIDSEEAEKVFKEIEQIQIMEKEAYEEEMS